MNTPFKYANKEISFNLEKNRWGIISRLKNSMATFAVISGLVGSILVITFVFIFDITLDSIFLQSLFVILLFVMKMMKNLNVHVTPKWGFSGSNLKSEIYSRFETKT